MPEFRDVGVHILNTRRKELREWGTEVDEQNQIVSCYIESKPNVRFHVAMTPLKYPFPALMKEFGDCETERNDLRQRNLPCQPHTCEQYSPAAWSFFATMHFDGQSEQEIGIDIPLHHEHVFCRRGEIGWYPVTMISECRRCEADGDMRVVGWVFKEEDVENLMTRLKLDCFTPDDAGQDHASKSVDESLAAALESLCRESWNKEKCSVGTIEITLRQAKLVKVVDDQDPAKSTPSYGNDPGNSNTTHKISYTRGRKRRWPSCLTSELWKLRSVPTPFARFRFYYRSEEILRKYGFHGFPVPRPLAPSRQRQLQLKFGALAAKPLSTVGQAKASTNNHQADTNARSIALLRQRQLRLKFEALASKSMYRADADKGSTNKRQADTVWNIEVDSIPSRKRQFTESSDDDQTPDKDVSDGGTSTPRKKARKS